MRVARAGAEASTTSPSPVPREVSLGVVPIAAGTTPERRYARRAASPNFGGTRDLAGRSFPRLASARASGG